MVPKPKITFSQARVAAVSGKWSVAFLVLCFAVSGVLLPVAAHLPRWVEFEMVLGAWWLVWTCAIGWLLYRGCDLADDMASPHFPGMGTGPSDGQSGWTDLSGCAWIDLGGEGCGSALLVVGAVILLVVGIWFAVEFLIPGLAFLLYLLVRGMVARAVNDRRDCKASVLRAAAWAMAWATLYTAPLALTVLTVHAIHPHLHRH